MFCLWLTVVLHYSQTLCGDGHLRKSCSDQRSRKWQIPVYEPQGETSGQGMFHHLTWRFCRKCILIFAGESVLDF